MSISEKMKAIMRVCPNKWCLKIPPKNKVQLIYINKKLNLFPSSWIQTQTMNKTTMIKQLKSKTLNNPLLINNLSQKRGATHSEKMIKQVWKEMLKYKIMLRLINQKAALLRRMAWSMYSKMLSKSLFKILKKNQMSSISQR